MIEVTVNTKLTLDQYLALEYSFSVVADPDGGYVILFPDLPGCMTQVESVDEIPAMADEIRELWIESNYERGMDIPLPSYPEEYSGRFNLRLPRSLHRQLAESAEHESVSLNQYVVSLLSRRDADARVEFRLEDMKQQLETLCDQMATVHARLRFPVEGVPNMPQSRTNGWSVDVSKMMAA